MTSRDELVRQYPALRPLVDLVEAEWTFMPRHDDRGLDQLDGVHVWPGSGHADAIRVRSETDAYAVRIAPPDGRVVWSLEGTLADVVDGLMGQPPPGHRLAPRLDRGAAPGDMWIPGNGAA